MQAPVLHFVLAEVVQGKSGSHMSNVSGAIYR
jgi:hypothetical protein